LVENFVFIAKKDLGIGLYILQHLFLFLMGRILQAIYFADRCSGTSWGKTFLKLSVLRNMYIKQSSPSFFLKLFYNYYLVTVSYSNTSSLPLRLLQILSVFTVRNIMFTFSRALQFHVELMVKILQS